MQGVIEGIGIYFSSGDNGDESLVEGYATADWPASSPFVTAVGGTSLAVGASNNYLFETGWGTTTSSWTGTAWSPTRAGSLDLRLRRRRQQALRRAVLPAGRRPVVGVHGAGPHRTGRPGRRRGRGSRTPATWSARRRRSPTEAAKYSRVPHRRHQPGEPAVRGDHGAGRPGRGPPARLRQPGALRSTRRSRSRTSRRRRRPSPSFVRTTSTASTPANGTELRPPHDEPDAQPADDAGLRRRDRPRQPDRRAAGGSRRLAGGSRVTPIPTTPAARAGVTHLPGRPNLCLEGLCCYERRIAELERLARAATPALGQGL